MNPPSVRTSLAGRFFAHAERVSSVGRQLSARRLGYGLILFTLFTVSAELTARLQDRLLRGISLSAVPDWDRDLFIDTPVGRRGRPHGRYLKWELNEYGFRAGAMTLQPAAGTRRLMMLGASETFGVYESPGHEYPAMLAERVRGRYEVVNAALTGLTLSSTVPYWTAWVRRFHPGIVVIYPSPLFYLNGPGARDVAPSVAPQSRQVSAPNVRTKGTLLAAAGSLRLVQRARERLDVPDWIQRWRDNRTIRAATEGKPTDWLFVTPPVDRAELFIRDLNTLVDAIRADGARPIVMTHASRVTDPPRPGDLDWLERARVNTPRASALVIAQFETLVNRQLLEWARHTGVEVIDLRSAVGGREHLFSDLIHFNDAGAEAVSATIAGYLERTEWGRQQASATVSRDAVQ